MRKAAVKMIELRTAVRQSGDRNLFIDLLNQIGVGKRSSMRLVYRENQFPRMGSFQQSYTVLIRTLARRTTANSPHSTAWQRVVVSSRWYIQGELRSPNGSRSEQPSGIFHTAISWMSRGASSSHLRKEAKVISRDETRLRRCVSSHGGSSAKISHITSFKWYPKMKVYFREDHQVQWLGRSFLSSWLGVLQCISHKEWRLKGRVAVGRCIWLRTSLCCIQSYYYVLWTGCDALV